MERLIQILGSNSFAIGIERSTGNVEYHYDFAFKRNSTDTEVREEAPKSTDRDSDRITPRGIVAGCIKISRGKDHVRHPIQLVAVNENKGFLICDYRGEINKDNWTQLTSPHIVSWIRRANNEYWFTGSIRDMQVLFTLGGVDDHFGVLSALWGKVFTGKAVLKLGEGGATKLEVYILGGWLRTESTRENDAALASTVETEWLKAADQV